MKLPTPKKLPSGSWNVQVMVDGNRVSITAPTEKEALARAAEAKAGMRRVSHAASMTVGDAIDRYIASKDSVWSPATVTGYRRIRRNYLQELMSIRLRDLSQERVQRAINAMARIRSPKTVRNAHGLLSAALSIYYPDFILRTTLPQKRRYEAKVPDMDEIAAIVAAVAGTEMELPVLLAVWMGLRVSEIRGLTWGSIDGDYLHIRQAIVDTDTGPALKGTKTYSGDRWVRLPEYIRAVIAGLPHDGDFLVRLSGQAIYKRFSRLCQSLGLPHYRFHDLRHAAASVAMSLGVPNTYTQQRMGHKTDHMLKSVYLHTLKSKTDEFSDRIDGAFQAILQTNLQTGE